MTKLSEIQIIDRLPEDIKKPISTEEVAECFYGITDILFVMNVNISTVHVFTKNLCTVHISKLLEVQKKLKANSISISQSLFKEKMAGLVYIISY